MPVEELEGAGLLESLRGKLFLYFPVNSVERRVIGLEMQRFSILSRGGNHDALFVQIRMDMNVPRDFEHEVWSRLALAS